MKTNTLKQYLELTKYFLPLALQSASQSITYPLVSIVASNGSGGPLELAGLAQSNSIMFLLGTLGSGLITTGMVYAKSRQGFARFTNVNMWIAIIVIGLQAIISIPPFAHYLFGTIIGLPNSIEPFSSQALLATIPLQFFFFLRNPYQVVLYNNNATALASSATIARILFTISLAPLCCYFGLTGTFWAIMCLTAGVILEAVMSWYFARPYLKKMENSNEKPTTYKELYGFTFPLSVGGLFLSLSSVVIGMVLAHASNAENLLTVYYLASGIAGPMSFAASRNQVVTIAFANQRKKDKTTFWFSVLSGGILGFIPLLLIIPGIDLWYYISLQNLDQANLPLLKMTAFALVINPLGVGIRAHYEGIAALKKRPNAVLIGQGIYLCVLSSTSLMMLLMKVPGNIIPPITFIISNVAAAGAIVFVLASYDRSVIAVVEPHTTAQSAILSEVD